MLSTYINNGRLSSPKQKNDILLFEATCMHLEAIILSEQSQTETYIQYHSYVTSKKFNLVNITEKTQTQNSLPVGRGTVRGNTEGGGGEVQAPVPKTAYKDAMYNTGI